MQSLVFPIKFRIKVSIVLLLFAFNVPQAMSEEVVWKYTVRPKDNLITLGRIHLINPDDWKVVQQLNRVKDPYRMPIGLVLKVPLALVKQGPASAEVISISGTAELQTSHGYSPIQIGQILVAGARLLTKGNSKASIRFADGTIIHMASNTELVLDALSLYSGGAMVDTKLRLQKGQVETFANPKHTPGNTTKIITPTAIAAVRGTQFRVEADDVSIKQETLEGKVSLQAELKEVLVDKGYGSFAQLGKPPSVPVALLPPVDTSQLSKQINRLPIQFDLPQQSGAVAWSGQVFTDASLKQIVADVNSNNSSLVFNDLPDGHYVLNIRAKDKNGLAGYDAQHAFVVDARPFAPELVSPAQNGVVRYNRPLLQWSRVEDAQRYLLEVATDDAFSQHLISQYVENNSFQLLSELAPRQYFWRVTSIAQAVDGHEDAGIQSEVSQFTYKALPPQPDISQMGVKVSNNRVYIDIPSPPKGLVYKVVLENPFNHQKNVWIGKGMQEHFSFLLKEYGEQVLLISYLDDAGVAGPGASYVFEANPR
ncbi:MAG: FecR domain-containing protein [Methylophilus sp.]